jgi:hypothetical protein
MWCCCGWGKVDEVGGWIVESVSFHITRKFWAVDVLAAALA